MAIEKINSVTPAIHAAPMADEKKSIKKENIVDEEKSMSMNTKLGLCAAAAVAIGGIILYARKGKAPKSSSNVPGTGGGGRPQPLLQLLLRLLPVLQCLSL